MEKCKIERCLDPGMKEIKIQIEGAKEYIIVLCMKHRNLLVTRGPDWFELEQK